MGYRKIPKKVFSQRYSDLISDNEFISLDGNFKVQLYNILSDFEEPCIERPHRYNQAWTENTTTSYYVFIDLDKIYNGDISNYITDELIFKKEASFIFDIIELWALHNNDENLPLEINSFFEDNDLPWRLLNGDIIKIDSKQFECDLLRKHLNALKELQTVQPLFRNAYAELLSSVEFFEKQNYKDSILKAEQSYESILKVITSTDDGQADSLITKAINMGYIDCIPNAINKTGFSDKVLKALPYIRNQTKVGHGEGGENIIIGKELARLAINMSCALSSFFLDCYALKV